MPNYYDEDIIPKHRKRSKKKTPKKSDHKHLYEDVLMRYILDGVEKYYSGTECTICGKIGKERYFETKRTERGYYRTLTQEELLEKYKGVKIIEREPFG